MHSTESNIVHGQGLGRSFKINILAFGGVKPCFSPVQWVTAVELFLMRHSSFLLVRYRYNRFQRN